MLLCSCVYAKSSPINQLAHISTPWFTGPLLAPSGHTVAAGKQNIEPYLYVTDNIGFYNNRWHLVHQTKSHSISPTFIFTQGMTRFMDIKMTVPYDFNSKQNQHDNNIGDISLILGLQVLQDKAGTIIPDLRMTIKEGFPTGRYENLIPRKLATDATGSGSYQTGVGLNFQKLMHIYKIHFLRTRLSLVYTIPLSTTVHNFNTFGGGFGTDGTINFGNKFSVDLAFEYNLSKNWVYAMDILYTDLQNSKFLGFPGINSNGRLAKISTASAQQLSLAPALEYNFNKHFGMLAGAWFSVTGQDATDFVSGVVALNYYS